MRTITIVTFLICIVVNAQQKEEQDSSKALHEKKGSNNAMAKGTMTPEEACGMAKHSQKEVTKAQLWEKLQNEAGGKEMCIFVYRKGDSRAIYAGTLSSISYDKLDNRYTLRPKRLDPFVEMARDGRLCEIYNNGKGLEAPIVTPDSIVITPSDLLGVMTISEYRELLDNESNDILRRRSTSEALRRWRDLTKSEIEQAKCVIKRILGIPDGANISFYFEKEKGSAILSDGTAQMEIDVGGKKFRTLLNGTHFSFLREKGKETEEASRSTSPKSLSALIRPPLDNIIFDRIAKGENIVGLFRLEKNRPNYLLVLKNGDALKAIYVNNNRTFDSASASTEHPTLRRQVWRFQNERGEVETIEEHPPNPTIYTNGRMERAEVESFFWTRHGTPDHLRVE